LNQKNLTPKESELEELTSKKVQKRYGRSKHKGMFEIKYKGKGLEKRV